jgi:phosphoribosylformylglycinamidine cyclo-ligase
MPAGSGISQKLAVAKSRSAPLIAHSMAKKKTAQPAAARQRSTAPKKAYAEAGVDIELGDRLKGGLKESLKHARRPEVLGSVGGFGGLFDISKLRYKEPVLVSSVDGVGTKLRLAFSSGRHEVVGRDIVNHCVNDIAVLGAEPLFFLDYIGLGKLEPKIFHGLIAGMAEACREARCALIGGETAQMPGFYRPGEYDLVGCIVGVAEKKRLVSGESIQPGDVLIGLASNGLHTNGYSLAQKLLFEDLGMKPSDRIPGHKGNLLSALLQPHVNYSPALLALLKRFNRGASGSKRSGNAIHGIAHITGGGFSGNIPRVLPATCDAVVNTAAWPKLPIFQFLADRGGLDFSELYEVFNMGVGMVLAVSPEAAKRVLSAAAKLGHQCWVIGKVTAGSGEVQLRR